MADIMHSQPSVHRTVLSSVRFCTEPTCYRVEDAVFVRDVIQRWMMVLFLTQVSHYRAFISHDTKDKSGCRQRGWLGGFWAVVLRVIAFKFCSLLYNPFRNKEAQRHGE